MKQFLLSILPSSQRNTDYIPALTTLLRTKSHHEILAALVLHWAAYMAGGKGPSVIYNYLGGIRLMRHFPPYEAGVVLAWDGYDVTQTGTGNITYFTHLAHLFSFSLGVLSAKYDLV